MNSFHTALALLLATLLAACGGGSSSSAAPSAPSDADRQAAATQTATSAPACATARLGSFYWEIGDAFGVRGRGQVGSGAPDANTPMAIASSSKWVYAAYVLQKVGGVRPVDIAFLNFTSGYNEFVVPLCPPLDTVAGCLDGKDGQIPSTIGKFFYGSGHMQVHATREMAIGWMGNADLSAEIASTIGDFGFTYTQPQLAGGLAATASGYGAFLRSMLRGELRMAGALGTHKVCTNPTTCSTAIAAPIPDSESWNYSLGHWVEDDPSLGDHSYSSAGALGFYPWIDATKSLYGILARRSEDVDAEGNAGYNSAACGRLIRRAWQSGTPSMG